MNFEEFLEQYQNVPVEEYPSQIHENPVVSVCVQTYQHAPFIRECLDSILMQKTDFPFEILLGEDASTDGTREICIEYADKHPDKIRLFLHNRLNNIKIIDTPTGRFNTLYNFYTANGKYIAFCEGDDYWTDPNKLQHQFEFMDSNPEYSICGHDGYIKKNGSIIKQSKLRNDQKKDYSKLELQQGVFILTMSIFFKNVQVYPWECTKLINFDTFLFVYLGEFGHFKYLDKIQPACYRIHDGGMWSANSKVQRELSDIHTFFWISKYFERKNRIDLKNHFGVTVTKNTLKYLVEPTWLNYLKIIKQMIILKFPKLTTKFHDIPKIIMRKKEQK